MYNDIKLLVEESKNKVYKTVNTEMITLYWSIGKLIIEKQGGNERAKYKDYITAELSGRLTKEFGKGFSKRNLERMRKFYIYYSNATTLMSQLTWSHYLELIKIYDTNKRNFYMKECINSNWDVRELQRQRTTLLYERIAYSKDKNETVVKYPLPENNKIIVSSEFRLTIPTEQEFINVIENEKKNLKLIT